MEQAPLIITNIAENTDMARKGIPTFKKELNDVKTVLEHLPDEAGQIAVDHAHKNFDKQQFGDKGKSGKWQSRKASKNKRDEGRAILIKSGELKASIDYEAGVMQVSIGSDKVYAERHNEGLKGMPKRQYMGPSPEIDDEIEKHLDGEMDKIFD